MIKPRYQEVRSNNIPILNTDEGASVRVVAGQVGGIAGPVTEIAADPLYIDVTVPAGSRFVQAVPEGHNAFAYVFEGSGSFGEPQEAVKVDQPALVIFGAGDSILVSTDKLPVRFLFVAGKPLNEPIARYGPFVMNTKAEIEQALEDLRRGTFVRQD